MYTENALRGPIAETFAEKLRLFKVRSSDPIGCDRWLARSLLHKAIRRGEVRLALRALATLIREHPAGIWRALAIIAMEDVGVSGIEALAAVIIAGRDQRWRERHGGDWKIAAYLVRELCVAEHDQAVCDLFDHARESRDHAGFRNIVLEEDMDPLIHRARCGKGSLVEKAIVMHAIGGGLADGQRHRDPFAIFELFADLRHCWEVADLCRAAWRITRCELALLLPLIWQAWQERSSHEVADDPFPPTKYIGEVPEYAVDQFTRSGIQVARRLLTADPALRRILDQAGIPRCDQHRTVGDLLFQIEGGLLSRRVEWTIGDELRLPYRCLADTVTLDASLPVALERVTAQAPLIASLREELISSINPRPKL